MEPTEDVVIVGCGPAGAYCAFELAQKGTHVTVFDHSHPREKPCGGGISSALMEKFPFVQQLRSKGRDSPDMTIISPDGSQVKLQGVRQGFNISRQIFDENLLNMATNSGAKLIREKVTEIKRRKRFWEVRTNKQSLSTRILVGADGVNSLVRRKTIGSIPREELGIAYGYIATGVENEPTTMKFLKDHLGYIWITPRGSHSCVGVCSEIKNGSKLKKILDDFVAFHCPSIKIASRFAAMFPFAKSPGFFDLPCAGNDWILVGDAAGHADPVTGEGILYALWSGKLAAETIRRNELGLYDGLWKKEYGGYLLKRAADKDTFYNPLTIELSMMLRSALGKR